MRNLNLLLAGSRGFILAILLGPASYGVLGGLIALQQLLSYAALGMREGVLIELAQQATDNPSQINVYSSALVFAAAVGLSLPILFSTFDLITSGGVDINHLLIAFIGGFSVVNEVLVNLNRYEGNLMRVSFCETSYNLIILLLVFALHSVLGVPLVLCCILLGVSFSVSVYLLNLRLFSLRAVTFDTMRRLVGIGFFSSVLSALMLAVNLMFILLAQRYLEKAEVGHFVFASNIATMLLVSLNAFSWAMTSRTLGDLAGVDEEALRRARVQRTDAFMRVGIAGAVVGALAIALLLPLVVERYAGSGRYILLFVSLQSFQLLAFTEFSFLMLRNKVHTIILIFAAANLINYLLVATLAAALSFQFTMLLAVFCTAGSLVLILKYAARLGFVGTPQRAKYLSVLAVLSAVVLSHSAGALVALVFGALVFASIVRSNWRVLVPA